MGKGFDSFDSFSESLSQSWCTHHFFNVPW